MQHTIYTKTDFSNHLMRYFNKAKLSGSKLEFITQRQEIYFPKLVESIRKDVIPEDAIGVDVNTEEMHPIFEELRMSKSLDDTKNIMDLLSTKKYKILGSYENNSPPNMVYVSLKFDKNESDYRILDNPNEKDVKSVIDSYRMIGFDAYLEKYLNIN